jgi:hypothetical protein
LKDWEVRWVFDKDSKSGREMGIYRHVSGQRVYTKAWLWTNKTTLVAFVLVRVVMITITRTVAV